MSFNYRRYHSFSHFPIPIPDTEFLFVKTKLSAERAGEANAPCKDYKNDVICQILTWICSTLRVPTSNYLFSNHTKFGK